MNYVTYQQRDCFTGCIVNGLRALDADVSEADVLLYGGGFRIRYKTITLKDNSKYLIYGELREACLAFLDKIGIRYELSELGSKESALEKFRAAKAQGANVMFSVRADCIGYDPIFKQAVDSTHCLNILGIDEAAGTAIVSDGYIPTTPITHFEGEMPLERLLDGHSATSCQTLVIYPPEKPVAFRQSDESAIIRGVLERYLLAERDGENYTGYMAIQQLCSDLENIKDWDRQRFRDKLMDLNTVYKTWGFIGSKRILAELCRERAALVQYYDEMNDIAEKWNGLSRFIVKAAISGRPAMIGQLQEKTAALIEQEKELYGRILRHI